MDNLALTVTKSIAELLEANEKRNQEQAQRLSEIEKKVEVLVKENNKLKEDLSICKKQEEDSRLALAKNAASIQEELKSWTTVVTTVANQLNGMKDQNIAADNKIIQLSDIVQKHQKHLKQIYYQLRNPPAPTYVQRVNHVPRSFSSRFSNIEQSSSPLHESIDDEEISELSDQTEHLKRGVDALNELQRSFEKNSLYYDDLHR